MTPKLFDFALSGNCHKIKLFCSLVGVDLEVAPVDLAGGEQRRPPLSDLNPFGQLPILVDGEVTLRDSQTILVYLARRHERDDWLPRDAVGEARVLEWLFVAENEIARGPADARSRMLFGRDFDIDRARAQAGRILALMEAHLATRAWLALDRPTLADVACQPYVAVAHQGGVALDPYPAVRAWLDRVAALPGFLPMPGQPATAGATP
ncbi:MAG: glutathione S-transferase [Hyphomicrobiales bacterium]|nr:glutathione S-transferase [Hyphomicrobiales bacterium]